MSEKLLCPGCNTYTSSVLEAWQMDEPCPKCGLSAEAISEVRGVRRRLADEALKTQCEHALIRADRAETRLRKLELALEYIRAALAKTEERS